MGTHDLGGVEVVLDSEYRGRAQRNQTYRRLAGGMTRDDSLACLLNHTVCSPYAIKTNHVYNYLSVEHER